MKNFKYLFSFYVVITLAMFIYSCGSTEDTDSTHILNLKDEMIASNYLDVSSNIMKQYTKTINLENRGNTINDCFDETGCVFLGTFTDTIPVPGYGSCLAVITWDQYWCPFSIGGTLAANVVFENFSAAPLTGAGCDSLNTSWYNLFLANNLAQFESDLYDFNYAAREDLQKMIMEQYTTLYGTIVDCEDGAILLYSKFNVATCYKTCFKFVFSGGRPYTLYISKLCGDVCCEATTAYCWNSKTMQIETSDPTYNRVGFCSEELETDCPVGWSSFKRGCTDICE